MKQSSQLPSFRPISSRNEEQKKEQFLFSSDPNRNYLVNKSNYEVSQERTNPSQIQSVNMASQSTFNSQQPQYKRNQSSHGQYIVTDASQFNNPQLKSPTSNLVNPNFQAFKPQIFLSSQDKQFYQNQFSSTSSKRNGTMQFGGVSDNHYQSRGPFPTENYLGNTAQTSTFHDKSEQARELSLYQQMRGDLDESPQLNHRTSVATSLGRGDPHFNSRFTPESQTLPRDFQSQNYGSASNNQHLRFGEGLIDTLNPLEQLGPGSQQTHVLTSPQLSNVDMEQIIMNLHNKMKNLESKYIDLANFYKKELVNRRDSSPIRISGVEDSQKYSSNMLNFNKSRSPYRSQHQTIELDQNVETGIINDLLEEKNEMERELQNMISLQSKYQEDESQLYQKLAQIKQENVELKQLFKKQSNSGVSSLATLENNYIQVTESIKQNQNGIVDAFQGTFLEFINNNYNSFTENDVLWMFGKLKNQLCEEVEKALKQSIGSQSKKSFKEFFESTYNKNHDIVAMTQSQNDFHLQELSNLQVQLQEMKVINEKMHHEMQMVNEKCQSLKQENLHLSHENKRQKSGSINQDIQRSSPYSARLDQQLNEEMMQLKQKLRHTQAENQELEKALRSFNRQIDQKNEEIEKLNFELEKQKTQSNFGSLHQRYIDIHQNAPPTPPSLFTVTSTNLDQVQFYKEQTNNQAGKLKELMKLTTKFLSSMKKLQKAVHKKEPNVSKEKQEFEENRKELENNIRGLRKEFEQAAKVSGGQDSSRPYSKHRELSLDGNTQGSSKYSQLLNYQSRVPNQFNKHGNPSITNLKSKPMLSQTQASHIPPSMLNSKSFNTQNQFSIVGTSLMNTNDKYPNSVYDQFRQSQDDKPDNYSSIRSNHGSKERSPVPLRQNVHNPTSGGKRTQQEMFRSLDTHDRRPMFGSLERDQFRSPSANYDPKQHKKSGQALESSSKKYQMNNLKTEVNLLKHETQDLIHERDHLKTQLQGLQSQLNGMQNDNQYLQKQLERDRRKQETTKREINDLQLEKESLLQEFKRVSSAFNPQISRTEQLDQEIERDREILLQQLQDENIKQEEELIRLGKVIQEYTRTMGFMEESQEAAKSTITELKEVLASKDLEMDEIKRNQKRESQRGGVNEKEFKLLKNQLVDQIEQVKGQNEQYMSALEDEILKKEEEIIKVKRHLERKIKEKELSRAQIQVVEPDREAQKQVQELQAQIYGYEASIQKLNEEASHLQKKIDQKEKQLSDQKQTFNKEKQKFESQLKDLELQFEQEREDIQNASNQRIEQIKSQVNLKKVTVPKFVQTSDEWNEELSSMNQLQQDNDDLREELVSLQKSFQEQLSLKDKDWQNQLNNLKQGHQHQLKNLQSQMNKYNEDMEELQQNNQSLQEQVADLQNNQNQAQASLKQQLERAQKKLQQQEQLIQESRNEVEQKDQQILQKEELLAEKEIELKNLEKNFEAQKKAITDLENRLKDKLQKQGKDLEYQLQTQQEKVSALESEKASLISQLEKASSQIQDKDQSLRTIESENKQTKVLQQSLKKQLMDIQRQMQQQSQEHEEDKSNLQQELEDLHEQLSEKEGAIKKLETQITQMKQDMATKEQTLNTQLESATQNYIELKQQFAVQKQQIELKQSDIANLNSVVEQQGQEINKLNQQIEQLKKNYKGLEEKAQELDQEVQMRDQQLEENEQLLAEKDTEILELNKDVEQQRGIIKRLETKIQEHKQRMGSEKEQISSYEEAIQKLQDENEDLIGKVQERDGLIKDKDQTIKDVENENKYAKIMQQNFKTQIEEMQGKFQDQHNEVTGERQKLNTQLQDLQNQLDQRVQEASQLNESLHQLKQEQKDKEHEHQKSHKQSEQAYSELLLKFNQKEHELEKKQQELEEVVHRKDLLIQQAEKERDDSHQQLSNMLNQNQFEKQSLEENLQQQLSETLKSLQLKEKECKLKDQQIEQVESQIKEIELREDLLKQQYKILDDQNQQLQEEVQDAQNIQDKNQAQLESNRNLIQMLKNEFQKSIEKQRALEQQVAQTQGDNSEKEGLSEEIEKLKEKISSINAESDEKVMDIQMKLDEKETEIEMKNQIIEEANKAIEEFYEEQHELKARFKHLNQLMENPNDEESEYREGEEVDLEECFNKIEKEMLKWVNKKDQMILQLEKDSSLYIEQIKSKEEELGVLQKQMEEVKGELGKAIAKQEANDQEMRRQLEVAARKIDNYKDKVVEKQSLIATLESEKAQQKKDGNLMKENIELIQKLQKAENELQTYRLGSMKKFSSNDLSGDQNSLENIEKISYVEEQIEQLRKQLFQAKDQVISNLSDTFAQRIKELQQVYINENVLKDRLASTSSNFNIDQAGFNTQIKECKKVQIGEKTLFVLQCIPDQSYQLVDSDNITETALQFIRNYVQPCDPELSFDQKQEKMIINFQNQLKDMRTERNEIRLEMMQIKQRFSKGGDQLDEIAKLQAQEFEEEVGDLRTEVQELTMKIKDLSILNVSLKSRIAELNQILIEYVPQKSQRDTNSQNIIEKVINLTEENKQLQNQLEDIKRKSMGKPRKYDEEEKQSFKNDEKDPSFLGQITPGGAQDQDNNFFNQSSIEGVIEGLEGDDGPNTKQMLQQKIKGLEYDLDQIKQQNKNLTAEIQRSQQNLNQTDAMDFKNIKGTLIMFLKNCPITDKNNENLLCVIFSLMSFTRQEIQDVQSFRTTKKTSVGSNEAEEELKKQTKKGLFGMFKKKDKDSEKKQGASERSQSQTSQGQSPMRPIKR